MGLVQREIEAAGFTTITLSGIPDFTASVSVPRVAGLLYPPGRPLGQPGDRAGQLAVLRATLQAIRTMEKPGEIRYFPFTWPEPARKTVTHPDVLPPIATYLRRHPWLYRKLLARDVPE